MSSDAVQAVQDRTPQYEAVNLWPTRSRFVEVTKYLFVILVAFVCIAPLYAIFTGAFADPARFLSTDVLPRSFTLKNFGTVWTDLGFKNMLMNSLILTLPASTISTGVAVVAAFGLSRFRFPGRALLVFVFVASVAIPPIVVLPTLFITYSHLGWTDTWLAAILTSIGLQIPFSTFLMYSYMRDLPKQQFEAARVEGAGSIRQFALVAVPMSLPAISTTFLLAFVFVWNDLLVPLFLLPSAQKATLMTGLAALGPSRQGTKNIPLLMAGVVISIAPMIPIVIFGRRALTRGLVESGG